jgi:hypothetical protein
MPRRNARKSEEMRSCTKVRVDTLASVRYAFEFTQRK